MKLLLAMLLASNGLCCDVIYDFGDQDHVIATHMEATLTWWQIMPASMANVYLSTATGTACNSGYFGAQFHSDGSTTLLFSMWDSPSFSPNPEFVFQSLPASPHCHRNALDATGKSTGTQCAPDKAEVSLELGVPYTFTFGIVAQNASGATWEVSMRDPKYDTNISVGRIFFVDMPMGLPVTCRTLGKSQNPPTSGLGAYTFMEYFAQPREYLSAASWSELVVRDGGGPDGRVVARPQGIAGECCDHGDFEHGDRINGSSSTCLPPECDSPDIHFVMGPDLKIPSKILVENPTCLGPRPMEPREFGRNIGSKCWSGRIPNSLDECHRVMPSSDVVI